MLCAYADLSNSTQNICNKIFKELCHEWFSSARLHVKHSSYCCYEKLIAKHITPYFGDIKRSELGVPIINEFSDYMLKFGKANRFGGLSAKSVTDKSCKGRTSVRDIPVPAFVLDVLN